LKKSFLAGTPIRNSRQCIVASKSVSIQVQPDRSPHLDCKTVVKKLLSLASESQARWGEDGGRYVNVLLSVPSLSQTWSFISEMLNENPDFAMAAIVTCQGDNGWDEYLLLHHFDPSEPLDKISN
jgi:hypothetical protein